MVDRTGTDPEPVDGGEPLPPGSRDAAVDYDRQDSGELRDLVEPSGQDERPPGEGEAPVPG